jgi:hypothetical protein
MIITGAGSDLLPMYRTQDGLKLCNDCLKTKEGWFQIAWQQKPQGTCGFSAPKKTTEEAIQAEVDAEQEKCPDWYIGWIEVNEGERMGFFGIEKFTAPETR